MMIPDFKLSPRSECFMLPSG